MITKVLFIPIIIIQFICYSHQNIGFAQITNSQSASNISKIKVIKIFRQIKYEDKGYKLFNYKKRLFKEIYYLKNGLKEKELIYNQDTILFEKITFEYDLKNNLICKLRTRPKYSKGGQYHKIDYHYNSKNQIIEKFHFRDINYENIVQYLHYKYTYNDFDSLLRINIVNHNGRTEMKTYYYNSYNRKVLKKEENDKNKEVEFRKFIYNRNGQLFFEKDSCINKSQYGLIYKYKGDKLIKKENIAYKHADIYYRKNEPDTFAVVTYKYENEKIIYKYQNYRNSSTETFYLYNNGLLEKETLINFNDKGQKIKTENFSYKYEFY